MEKKKKGICYFVLFLLVIILISIACKYEKTYKRKHCQVVSIDGQTITVKDSVGNFWAFFGQDFVYNDSVTLVMDTNNTDNNIKDDIIIDVIKE